jgi:branched-subunit amino acid aminotransferase/4-amino-4-deoxychorismate lyase
MAAEFPRPGEFTLFDPHTFELTPSTSTALPAVVDSFVVDEGRVRGLDRHIRRFVSSCAAWRGLDELVVREFAAAAVSAIPSTGAWFPRFELLDQREVQLALRLRPAPARRLTATLWLGRSPVARRAPRVKGPDLATLAELRDLARSAGADEAGVQAVGGLLLETSQSSLLWWRGDVLCAVPEDADALPGVTRDLLLEIAAADGYRIDRELARPGDLDGLEVWLVNALHGMRVVTEWVGAPIRVASPTRADHWRARLRATAKPM